MQRERSVIHISAEEGHSDVVNYLLSLPGINVDAQDYVSVYHEESLVHLYTCVIHFHNKIVQTCNNATIMINACD